MGGTGVLGSRAEATSRKDKEVTENPWAMECVWESLGQRGKCFSSTKRPEGISGFYNQVTVKGRKLASLRYIGQHNEPAYWIPTLLNYRLGLVDYPFPDKVIVLTSRPRKWTSSFISILVKSRGCHYYTFKISHNQLTLFLHILVVLDLGHTLNFLGEFEKMAMSVLHPIPIK